MDVNTAEIRSVARRIRSAAETISSLASGDIRRMMQMAQESLQGLTADKLQHVLGELGSDFSSIASGLHTISQELMDYARRVDEADRQAEKIIKNL